MTDATLPGEITWRALKALVTKHPTDLIVVAARWLDAAYQEQPGDLASPIEMMTLGFVHKIGPRYISLAQEMDETRDPRHVTSIPKKYVNVLVLLGAIPTEKEPSDSSPHPSPRQDPPRLPAVRAEDPPTAEEDRE